MKKTIFLFGLFLMIYGTVSVKAQIRIGGESFPDSSAVLDLNSGNKDTDMATGGLLLPRVRLSSNTDDAVFGDLSPVRGLMVYNLNDGELGRPKEGVYCYDGTKWVSMGERDSEVQFTITVMNDKQLWLGRNGELRKTLKVNVVSNQPLIDMNKVTYEWTVSDSTIRTTGTELILNVGMLSPNDDLLNKANWYAVYGVMLTVKYLGYETKKHIATVSVGPGAWIGEEHWLKVANTNLGAIEDIPFEEQMVSLEKSEHFGYLYQWGSTCYRMERKEDDKNKRTLDASTFDETNGQLKEEFSRDVFLVTNKQENWGEDWRYYPEGYSSENPPSRWVWNPNVGNGNGYTPDPCRVKNGGTWRVPTVEDWNNIVRNNTVLAKEGPSITGKEGIAVSVSGKDSFFLPKTKFFNSSGNLSVYEGMAYWLNSPKLSFRSNDGSHYASALFMVNGIHVGELSSKSEYFSPKGSGLNIRCVAD